MFATWYTNQLLFDGVIRGIVYGLLAMSIILVYRSTKVINFAAGSMGLVGSALLVLLNLNYSVPYWLAVVIALGAGIAVGALVEVIVVRRLATSPRVILLVATIGVSQLAQVTPFALPSPPATNSFYPLAIGSSFDVGDVTVKGQALMVLIAAPLMAIGLGWFLNRTIAGRTVRASADNHDLTRLSGASPKLHSTLVWAVAGLIATVSMMLVGGLDGQANFLAALGPASLLRALVAALIARFNNFGQAIAVGVAIGVVEKLIGFNYFNEPGRTEAILLLVVLIAVAREERVTGASEAKSDFAFAPKAVPLPERLKGRFWLRNMNRVTFLVVGVIAVLAPIVVTQPSRHVLYASILAYTVCALSLTVLTGWGGQLSLGQMAFAGLGALTAAGFTRGLEIDWILFDRQIIYIRFEPIPFVISILLGAVVAGILAAIIGLGALRIRGLSLAVSTYALVVACGAYIYRLGIFSAGSRTDVRFPRGDLGPIDLDDTRNYYYFSLAVLLLVALMLGRIRRSGVGRVTIAVRDNPNSAAAFTVQPAIAKLRVFALAGFISGLGGGVITGIAQTVNFSDPRLLVEGSLNVVSIIVIGGLGSVAGAVLGALWVIGLPAFFPGSEIVPLLTSGLGLLILLMYLPGGLVNLVNQMRGALYRWLERDLPPITKSADAAPPASLRRSDRERVEVDIALRTTDVSVEFDGVKANSDVSIEVRQGEIVGLVGTNGAGKSTLMNAIGGFVPSTGTVELLGQDVSGDSAAARARLGLGRTFQAATLFPELSVRETLEVAYEARGRTSLLEVVLFSPRARARGRAQKADAADLIDFLGLGRYADRPINELSTGTRRIVELGGLLALDARVLCLDEPTAGVAQRESEALSPLLVEINKELDASMLIIEQVMPLIMRVRVRVYCLEVGRVIAQGTPDEVRNDPGVIASYLGTDERTIERSGPITT